MSSFFATNSTSGSLDDVPVEKPDDNDTDEGLEVGGDVFFSVNDFPYVEKGNVTFVDDIPVAKDTDEAARLVQVPVEEEQDIERSKPEGSVVVSTVSTIFSDNPNTVSLRKMRNNVFFTFPDWKRRVGAYYMLIFLAAIIATSGVAADSAATVIGAMIVAPLMTPILGVVLSLVTRDCKNLLVSIWLVFSGAMIAIGVGFVYGYFLEDTSILKENNSQIAARTLPRLTDLIVALATGAVGSFAMVREDISSTLPGVSIAISLVPPLNVVGLTLSTRSWEDAVGAMVLFLTNVS